MRRKQELDRRRVQQRSRKEEQKWAHKKFVARTLAKKYLVGLKEQALQELKTQGMLNDALTQIINEDVYPWMVQELIYFLNSDFSI